MKLIIRYGSSPALQVNISLYKVSLIIFIIEFYPDRDTVKEAGESSNSC